MSLRNATTGCQAICIHAGSHSQFARGAKRGCQGAVRVSPKIKVFHSIARLAGSDQGQGFSRDDRFGATPAGWATEYLRGAGGLLSIEIDDASSPFANTTLRGCAGI